MKVRESILFYFLILWKIEYFFELSFLLLRRVDELYVHPVLFIVFACMDDLK